MTDSCRGYWCDGRTAQRREAELRLEAGQVRVTGEGLDCAVPLTELRIDPGLGTVRRLVRFPDGAVFETAATTFLDSLQRRQGKGSFFRGVHRWESSLKRAVAALLATLLVAFCFVRYGLPFLATRAAYALPPATELLLGRETLQMLDKLVLQPTRLSPQRRAELDRLFATMTAPYPGQPWRLELRSARAVGANAFALPSGIVVVTDDLVALARNDDELAGVIAHEIGHVNRRHALRHLLQNSATALLVATLTGDVTSVTSLAATMPTALIDAKYSRDFEREADDAAVAYLKGRGVPVAVYAEMLARLDAAHWKERETAPRFGDLLDNHPLMVERVRRVMAAAPP